MKIMISLSTHYTDLYGKGFLEFRRKYGKVVRGGRAHHLWVQFTNYADDKLHKQPYANPDHADPVGIFGYPLKYVIENPADLWYGQPAKYLRVLESNVLENRVLYVQSLSNQWRAENFLNSLGYKPSEITAGLKEVKRMIKRSWTDGDKNTLAKAAFYMLQHNVREADHPLRSGLEQTKLLRAAGYEAVIDDAPRKSYAVINDREPNQIVFLLRRFEVLDIFENNVGIDNTSLTTQVNDDDLAMRLGKQIAEALGDHLRKDAPYTVEEAGWNLMWTKGGKRISVLFKYPSDYYNRRIGEKLHKVNKLSSERYAIVKVDSERGFLERTFDASDSFQEIAEAIYREYKGGTLDPLWKPESLADHLKRKDDRRKAAIQEQARKVAQIAQRDVGKLADDIRFVGQHFGIDVEALLNADPFDLEAACRVLRKGIDVLKDDGAENFDWDQFVRRGIWIMRIVQKAGSQAGALAKVAMDLAVASFRACTSDDVLKFRPYNPAFGDGSEIAAPFELFTAVRRELEGGGV